LSRDQPAFREHDASGDTVRSISNERTFREDVADPRTVDAQLCFLAERVCWRARRRGVRARTVALKLRYADFETLSRSHTLATPTSSELEVYPLVQELYRDARKRRTPIRLLGVALSNLVPDERQLGLFDSVFDPDRRVNASVDAIREKYGFDAVRRATGQLRRRRDPPADRASDR
jgi:DNA polymerase-4